MRLPPVSKQNREVRRVLEWCGVQVARLIRVQFGPYLLRDLPPGATARAPFKPIMREYLRRKNSSASVAAAEAAAVTVPDHMRTIRPEERKYLRPPVGSKPVVVQPREVREDAEWQTEEGDVDNEKEQTNVAAERKLRSGSPAPERPAGI